ncbi:MAG: SDR family NAD(P)-dependent oxidoreductase [Acetobacteraceae bacterium]|nr:SDR family NAD(P)-dependent oxidoreductase [Acetobacteraceae bacterium]
MKAISTALITGASSGIGEALAMALAAPGVTLHLSGRNDSRLAAVAAACRTRGAGVHPRVLDVRDSIAMAAWIAAAGLLDLVVANAGISAGTGLGTPETAAQARAIFATNLDGMLNTVLPAWQAMRGQPAGADGVRGRIAVIASIAAFVALAAAPSYGAAKAAVDSWTVGSAPAAAADGIRLTSVCPGYIRTAMTARNRFPMPGLMDADRAAAIILRGIAAGRVRLAFPWWMALAGHMAGLLPPSLLGKLVARPPGKAPNQSPPIEDP